LGVVRVIIVPIGSFPLSDAHELAEHLMNAFPIRLEAMVSVWRLNPPLTIFNWSRRQYMAEGLAVMLAESVGMLDPPSVLALGLSEADGYVEGLNFVFGLAIPRLGSAVVFTRRLVSPNRGLYMSRLLKESMHELGHLLGLEHCSNPRCVMSFSNSIYDVDRKEARFCSKCEERLRKVQESLDP
jgi:archaemetzincin